MLEAIAKKFYPTKIEIKEANAVVDEVVSKLKVGKHVIAGGSTAKGTFVRGKHDIDFFVMFDKEDKMNVLYSALKNIFGVVKLIQGSRDYYNVKYKGYNLEFVPILEIEKPEQAKNVMDVSPFHVKFINGNLSEKQKIDVVMLKQFCRSAGIYGAETHTRGFSGYSLELLIAYFGSFVKVLENLSRSVPPLVIFFSKVKPANIATLTIMDPIQPNRNASAALSGKNFSIFQLRAKQFMHDAGRKKNLLKYFTESKGKLIELKQRSRKRGTLLIIKTVSIDGDKKKNLGMLSRKLHSISSKIKSEGISIYDYGLIESGDKAVIYFELETLKLSKYKKHYGPPTHIDEKHFNEFMKKWERCFIYAHEGRLCVDVPRKYTNAGELAIRLLNEL